MGQRSQIYVIIKRNNEYSLVANYYGWNYGERMISRVRGTVEWLLDALECYLDEKKLRKIMDVNFDMHDVILSSDIVKEFEDDYDMWKDEKKTYAENFYDFCFLGQDNNNGQAYLYVDVENKKIKTGFTSGTFDASEKMLSSSEYLSKDLCMEKEESEWLMYMRKSQYYDNEIIKYTLDNVQYIEENTEQLTTKELEEILRQIAEQYGRIIEWKFVISHYYTGEIYADSTTCYNDTYDTDKEALEQANKYAEEKNLKSYMICIYRKIKNADAWELYSRFGA